MQALLELLESSPSAPPYMTSELPTVQAYPIPFYPEMEYGAMSSDTGNGELLTDEQLIEDPSRVAFCGAWDSSALTPNEIWQSLCEPNQHVEEDIEHILSTQWAPQPLPNNTMNHAAQHKSTKLNIQCHNPPFRVTQCSGKVVCLGGTGPSAERRYGFACLGCKTKWSQLEDIKFGSRGSELLTVERVVDGKTARIPDQKLILEISNTSDRAWKRFEATIDSGACEHVCPNSVAPGFAIQGRAASKAGVHFCGADGGRMQNLGRQSWTAFIESGTKTSIKAQVADRINRTLLSVSRLTESGK